MHEFSVMSDLVKVIRHEVESRGIVKVNEVYLEVGELAFLAPEQLDFAYGVLVEKDGAMKGSVLKIEQTPARVQCPECDYSGGVEYMASEDHHFRMPVIKCPECGGSVSIVSGRECRIRNLIAEVDDR